MTHGSVVYCPQQLHDHMFWNEALCVVISTWKQCFEGRFIVFYEVFCVELFTGSFIDIKYKRAINPRGSLNFTLGTRGKGNSLCTAWDVEKLYHLLWLGHIYTIFQHKFNACRSIFLKILNDKNIFLLHDTLCTGCYNFDLDIIILV